MAMTRYHLTCSHDGDNDFDKQEAADGAWVRAADVERVLQIYKDALNAIGYRKTCDCSKCVKGTKLLAQLKP